MAVTMKQETQPSLAVARKSLESYSLDHVRERLVRKNNLSLEVIDEAIKEYRNYLELALLGYGPLPMFSQEVDEVWHNHILFTKDYANFCQQVFGYFLHHNPKTSQEQREGVRNSAVQRFIEAYMTVFNSSPPAIWTGLKNALSGCDDGNDGDDGSDDDN